MIKELFVRKPRFSAKGIAETVFYKIFKEELRNTVRKIKKDYPDNSQLIKKEKLKLSVISLFVFSADYAGFIVFGNSKTAEKIRTAFRNLVKEEYYEYYDFINELSLKFAAEYYRSPEDPLFGLGISFSKCVNSRDLPAIITAMAAASEASRRAGLIIKYYSAMNTVYRII